MKLIIDNFFGKGGKLIYLFTYSFISSILHHAVYVGTNFHNSSVQWFLPVDLQWVSMIKVRLKQTWSCSMIERNKPDRDIHNSDSLNFYKLSLLKFARPMVNSALNINKPYGLELLPRLHCQEIKATRNFFLQCPIFQFATQSLLFNIRKIEESTLEKYEKTLLYGDNKFDLSCNKSIL